MFGLFHGNSSHLIQQMTVLIPLSMTLEMEIGSKLLILSYFICGILGTVCTWIIDRIYYHNDDPINGKIMADLIWSRGSSGHVYAISTISSIICGHKYIFDDIGYNQYGLLWSLITNFGFHLFSSKSHFVNNSIKSYSILILFCLTVFGCFGTLKWITINQYLCIYYIHLGIWRLYPEIYNVKNESLIAVDFKSHLIGASVGFLLGIIYISFTRERYQNIDYPMYNCLPLIAILISDGLCGQYQVHLVSRITTDH